ncbi:VOC family protein [Spirosoma sp. RP8]|uniref:VOC family protein n=1 Tax=Spirosoma liriopis TaxID=2937440 RepID=A0ABT0HU81_9BACT|nr:VOC family protein [Spirosoma liriopis]MCK8495754.1 VOC family protein [Spirosoma liriopis]
MNDNQAPRIKPVPDQYTAVTPWIISPSSAGLIDFLTAAFDAQEVPNSRITNEDGIIIHVVVKIGDAMILLFDSREGWPPSPSYLNLYVEDIASTAQKAQELGAVLVTNSTELWFGEKVCRLLDPFGNLWWLNQRVEAVDFTDPRVGQRASTDEAIAGIAYIQKSLNEAMLRQKDFFANSGE